MSESVVLATEIIFSLLKGIEGVGLQGAFANSN